MNQSLYAGECPNCRKYIRAGLSFSTDGIIPPPMILAGCGCSQPPIDMQLVYCGAHTDDKGVSGRDVLRADKPRKLFRQMGDA